MCDVDQEAVVTAADAPSIYDIPKVLHREGLDAYVVRRLGPALPRRRLDRLGRPAAAACTTPRRRSTIALVGKYIDLPDAYLSVGEALRAGGFAHDAKVQHPLDRLRRSARPRTTRPATCATWTRSACRAGSACAASRASSARSRYARTHGIPTLGLCLGLQCMVIEYARTELGLAKAGSTEFDPDTPRRSSRRWPSRWRLRRGRRRPGRHHAARPLPGRAQGGLDRPPGLRRRR